MQLSYFNRYEAEVGLVATILWFVIGGISLVLGLIVAIFNLKWIKLTKVISAGYFFGSLTFSIGSQVYISLFKPGDNLAKIQFFVLIGGTFLVGVVTAIPVLLKSGKKYGDACVGLAAGYASVQIFQLLIPSPLILTICSILMGLIAGSMSYVFQEPFQIIVIPCTASHLITSGILGLLIVTLSLVNLDTGEIRMGEDIASKTLFGLALILAVLNGYYHYRSYFLKRESMEVYDQVPTKPLNSESKTSLAAPVSAQNSKSSLPLGPIPIIKLESIDENNP